MLRNLMFLIPTIVALSLIVNGTALAGSIRSADGDDTALYGQPDPFAAVDWQWDVTDPKPQLQLQQASRAQSPGYDLGQTGSIASDDRDNEYFDNPE